MIRIDFDPAKIAGSSLLDVGDIKEPAVLAVKLRDAVDPLSEFLRQELSQGTRQQLDEYDGSAPLPDSLHGALVDELNEVLKGSILFDKKRFKGTTWTRETLLKALIKHDPKGSDVACFNRLLLEESYPVEISRSCKAEWDAWTLLAHASKRKVIAEWEEWTLLREAWRKKPEGTAPEFRAEWDDDVWKGFRDWLLENVFNNKCAYCETTVTGFPGDAEHFRPKGQVRVILKDGHSEIVKTVDEQGEEITHPGYFWLAYNWQNILPSCEFCNRFGGKKDLFPLPEGKAHVAVKRLTIQEIDKLLRQGTRSLTAEDIFYLEPEDLDVLENRLLLHPYYDRPEEHIYFKMDGKADSWHASEQGEASIEVYDLNNPKKVRARGDEQLEGRMRYFGLMAATPDNQTDLKNAAQRFKDEYYRGRKPYGVAVLDYIHDRLEDSPYDPDLLLGKRRKTE